MKDYAQAVVSMPIIAELEIPGIARPQGSKRAFPGKGGRIVMIEASKSVKAWRTSVAMIARFAMRARKPFDGAVHVDMIFEFERPKSHMRKGEIRIDSPIHHVYKPDVSKLLRSAEDAMTGIVYVDDSQICSAIIKKEWAARSRTLIVVSEYTYGLD